MKPSQALWLVFVACLTCGAVFTSAHDECPDDERRVADLVAFYETLLPQDPTQARLRRLLADIHLAAFAMKSETMRVHQCVVVRVPDSASASGSRMVALPTPVRLPVSLDIGQLEAVRAPAGSEAALQGRVHLDKAIDRYRESLDRDSEDSLVWLAYARSRQQRGDPPQALIPAYRTALALTWPKDDSETRVWTERLSWGTKEWMADTAPPVPAPPDWRLPTWTEVAVARLLPLLGRGDDDEITRLRTRAELLEARRKDLRALPGGP